MINQICDLKMILNTFLLLLFLDNVVNIRQESYPGGQKEEMITLSRHPN